MDPEAVVVALEGPSDSGKSTLAGHLAEVPHWQPSLVLPCYADLVAADLLPPDVASSTEQQLQGLAFFVELDRRRHEGADRSPQPRLVVADRSWLSLLAHTYAVEQSGGPAAYHEARAWLTQDESLLRPDLIIGLRADRACREARMLSEDRGSWFTSAAFNSHVGQFFDVEAPQLVPGLVMIDATGSEEEVLSAAMDAITESCLALRDPL